MRYLLKIFAVILFFNLNAITVHAYGQDNNTRSEIPELLPVSEQAFPDSLFLGDKIVIPPYKYTLFETLQNGEQKIVLVDSATLKSRADSLMRIPITRSESLLYQSNPLEMPLVYMGKELDNVWDGRVRIRKLLNLDKTPAYVEPLQALFPAESSVAKLRTDARTYIANNAIGLYTTTVDRLPNLSEFMSRQLMGRKLEKLDVYDDKIVLNSTKIEYERVKEVYWINKANAMLQFSQNYISPNWYQGGNSNLAFLSIFLAEFNFDNRKKIQWENKIEWRSGFNSVDGDTLRKISTNDDILRYLTKFGIKASGNWYYGLSGDFSTPLWDSYKGINSKELKTRFLTPVRANIGLGMDYKYKKIFSLMIAPISFKYIYINDTVNVNPNQFGIKKGENQLKQFGSSLLAQLNYSPMMNWNITSKFTFYTDYKKFEIDWEVVNNFTINRFLTARLLLNPRYDNTVILKGGERAPRVQFKELLSVGFSYRFI